MRGTVERITVYSAKGEAGREVSEGRLAAGLGLEGDFHATGGERQISLLLAEIAHVPPRTEQGLCLSRFKENITIRGLTPDVLKAGARLVFTEAALEITGETKHCHEECALFEAGKRCPLAGLSLFAKVVKSGVIHVGEEIVV